MIGLLEGKGTPAKKPPERCFVLRLTVVGCQPRVWRRLLVRESMWLSRLHDSIQVIFDWYDYQTHAFNFDDLRYGNPLRRDELTIEDDRDVSLADLDLEHRGERIRRVARISNPPGWFLSRIFRRACIWPTRDRTGSRRGRLGCGRWWKPFFSGSVAICASA